ncbi:MAG: hypothetical protein Q9159_000464 [Coniocarpon cinnabarinum]
MFRFSVPFAALAASIAANASPFPQAPAISNTPSSPAPTAADPALLQALELAPTTQERQSILTANGTSADNLIFTFTNTTPVADVTLFPAMVETHIDLSVGFINPCSIIMPHSHPHANEFLTVVAGELMNAQLLANDVVLNYTLQQFQGTVYSQGFTHYQFNPTCDPVTFAAGFDSNDPGRVKAAQSLLSILSGGASGTAAFPELLSPENIDEFRANVGDFAAQIDSCAKRCGLSG